MTLSNVLAIPSGNTSGPRIPELLYVLFQGTFACFTYDLPLRSPSEAQKNADNVKGGPRQRRCRTQRSSRAIPGIYPHLVYLYI